jgi:hypothetical protein
MIGMAETSPAMTWRILARRAEGDGMKPAYTHRVDDAHPKLANAAGLSTAMAVTKTMQRRKTMVALLKP